MLKPVHHHHLLSVLLVVLLTSTLAFGDVGTAARYSPPYTPTACYGYDAAQFPSSFLFASAGEGIWDNGAACGRQYLVRCISASVRGTCKPGRIIQVRILDRASSAVSPPTSDRATIILSTTAFQSITNWDAASIDIEYAQV